MRPIWLICLLLVAKPAVAQSVTERAAGLYGSATDPEQSCAVNPHELSFIDTPPHALFRWRVPRPDRDGRMSIEETYDLRGADAAALTLLREGDAPLAATGRRPVWLLRFTEQGYCWGRADWPLVRCIEPAVRCGLDAPTS
jgi:hypothetical protein